ncbi:MAG: aspartate carbamoyltransferase catalytic subunit [Alphaproteobacteria bacterium PRO2]|nr:aspartate carbamoyltransferase catalytic subunit [Alphaproteobacteria bacterium PRO2]
MKHLLGIGDLSKDEIEELLGRADYYARAIEEGRWDREKLKDKIILTLFFEASTRTLTSFIIAAQRLGANVVTWNPDSSSLSKGESFLDTIDTLNAMRPDAVIIRHSEYGAPGFVAKRADCPVINGGDSWREHPTQALLDALTLRQKFGKLEGLTLAIIGDIAHSRVAASNMILLRQFGVNVRVIAPKTLMPEKLPAEGIERYNSLADGLKGVDAVMTIRLQKERMQKSLIESDTAYFNEFGLKRSVVDAYCPKAVVLDPGPLVRGVHISDDIAEDPERSLILKQVANGIPTRMAVLDRLISDA